MAVLEHKGKVPLPDDPRHDLSVQIRLAFPDEGASVEEIREAAWEALQRYMRALDPGEWTSRSTVLSRDTREEHAPELPYHMPTRQRPPRPKLRPRDDVDLPRSTLKACHRLIDAVFLSGVHGRAVTTGDVLKTRKIAGRTLYRLIDEDSESWRYLKPYLRVYQSGSKKILDLTEEGRQLASQIRAGAMPM